MISVTVQYEWDEHGGILGSTERERCQIDVVTESSPDSALYEGDISLRILHCHPLTNSGTTIIIGLTRSDCEKLIHELLRGL